LLSDDTGLPLLPVVSAVDSRRRHVVWLHAGDRNWSTYVDMTRFLASSQWPSYLETVCHNNAEQERKIRKEEGGGGMFRLRVTFEREEDVKKKTELVIGRRARKKQKRERERKAADLRLQKERKRQEDIQRIKQKKKEKKEKKKQQQRPHQAEPFWFAPGDEKRGVNQETEDEEGERIEEATTEEDEEFTSSMEDSEDTGDKDEQQQEENERKVVGDGNQLEGSNETDQEATGLFIQSELAAAVMAAVTSPMDEMSLDENPIPEEQEREREEKEEEESEELVATVLVHPNRLSKNQRRNMQRRRLKKQQQQQQQQQKQKGFGENRDTTTLRSTPDMQTVLREGWKKQKNQDAIAAVKLLRDRELNYLEENKEQQEAWNLENVRKSYGILHETCILAWLFMALNDYLWTFIGAAHDLSRDKNNRGLTEGTLQDKFHKLYGQYELSCGLVCELRSIRDDLLNGRANCDEIPVLRMLNTIEDPDTSEIPTLLENMQRIAEAIHSHIERIGHGTNTEPLLKQTLVVIGMLSKTTQETYLNAILSLRGLLTKDGRFQNPSE
jgi:hypothetical protein